MQKNILIVFVICALCLVNSGNAIKCYKCTTLMDLNCGKDIIGNSTTINVVDCDRIPKPDPTKHYMPVTRCNKVISSDIAGSITTRNCQFTVLGSQPDDCTLSQNRQVENCYTCLGDLCNASTAQRASSTLPALAVSTAGRFMALGLAAIVALVSMHFVI